MSEQHQTRAWFAPKDFGYGATPSSWQGWAATIAFVLVVTLTAAFMAPGAEGLAHRLGLYRLAIIRRLQPTPLLVYAAVALESLAFIALARWKSSGPWVWRWGPGR